MTATPSAADQRENLTGVCGTLGEELGFNPLWLRIALGFGIVFAPAATIVGYAALGLILLAGRLLFRDRKPVAVVTPLPVRAPPPAPAVGPLPLAA